MTFCVYLLFKSVLLIAAVQINLTIHQWATHMSRGPHITSPSPCHLPFQTQDFATLHLSSPSDTSVSSYLLSIPNANALAQALLICSLGYHTIRIITTLCVHTPFSLQFIF